MADMCSTRSRGSGEAVQGTASRARRWILLEQPGPWGADALTESALPEAVAIHLRALSRRLPARVLLLRRTGGSPDRGTVRSLFVGRSEPDGGWLERLELDHVHDVLDLDLDPLVHDESVGGNRIVDPMYLVCTNGKHDPCCARLGLPVARALTELLGERVWECSHVGGDRFAGNVVCLPQGMFYGHLDPQTAKTAVAAHEGGRLLLERWRGRSTSPFAAQAAEALLRRELGLERIDALRCESVTRLGSDHRVRFSLFGDRAVTAVVREGRTDHPRPLTCAGEPARAPVYELVSFDPPSEPTGVPIEPPAEDDAG